MRTMEWIKQRLLSPMILALVTVGPGLLYPAPAGAADTLDQSQIVSMSSATVSSSAQHGQIFTAGVYGTLDRVSLLLGNYTTSPPTGAFLTVSVQTVIAGLPSGKQIGSGTIPLSAIPPPGFQGWVDVSIRGAVVAAGTQYALVLQTSNFFASVDWWYAYTSYAGGERVVNDGTAWRIWEIYNFTFQTYVIPDTLDQSHNSTPYPETTSHVGTELGQTFTAGLSGVLDRVSVIVGDNGGLASRYFEATIQTVKAGYPSGTVIGRTTFAGVAIPYSANWVTIPISAAVTAGTQYALVLHMLSGAFVWVGSCQDSSGGAQYTGGNMMLPNGSGWMVAGPPWTGASPQDAMFQTYVATPIAFAPPPPPPLTSTPCSSGVCPAVSGSVTPPDSTARVTSNVQFQELPDGTVHGILNFDDSRTGDFVLQGCTTASAACRLTVTTIACTDQHAITVAGTYTPKGESAGEYLLTLSGVRNGIGTFTLTADEYTYTLTRNGIVDVTCPPGAGAAAGQR